MFSFLLPGEERKAEEKRVARNSEQIDPNLTADAHTQQQQQFFSSFSKTFNFGGGGRGNDEFFHFSKINTCAFTHHHTFTKELKLEK